ncbi:hypothetical protein EW026_g1248 [Hermanssonia centrifuga]|uniref:Glycosyl hydrolase family 13 catalytic domain-containing protein n=1 Tax=Hermanssonia centrifuga TaxID=98765 RepID=A0A4S4KS28_9APHY|nr:hypothetical protein EW026_g1248 [Hermanssonia centrifuga]
MLTPFGAGARFKTAGSSTNTQHRFNLDRGRISRREIAVDHNTMETLWDWIRLQLKPHPPPSLPRMRLSPEGHGNNPLMVLQFFTWESKHPDMSWWKHFETEVPTLAELGFTQIWLPPPNKAMTGQGYDAYDLVSEFNQKGTVATRWGSKNEFVQAIATAKAHGIDVLIDAVLNHKLGADRVESFKAVPVDPQNRLKSIGPVQEIEGWTAFDFSGRAGKYSNMKWTHEHFTGVDWDNRSRKNGIYRIVSDKHQGWSPFVDKELGNYDYLLGVDVCTPFRSVSTARSDAFQIDHRNPEVRKDILEWAGWVLQTTGAMGFRLDAIKHMDRRFLLTFVSLVSYVQCFETNYSIDRIKPYIRAFEGLLTFFDVPLHYNFHKASKAGSSYDLRTILNKTLVKERPGDAVTFVDNHDTQIGQTLESWVYSKFKLQAYALILLREQGHP